MNECESWESNWFSKRAENGPTAYIVEKIDESTCKFTWILNVDLKVKIILLFIHTQNDFLGMDSTISY
jgi:hypothetical protein